MARCAFCTNKANSGEHVFADWSQKYVPHTMINHRFSQRLYHVDRIDEKIRHVSGDPRSRKVKFVCRDCNTGWMSRLQNAAKQYAVPLILGQKATLDTDAQRALSGWIAMSALAAEFIDRNNLISTPSDCAYLKGRWTAPIHWSIWIGDYDDAVGFSHHWRCLWEVYDGTDGPEPRASTKANIHTLSYRLGRLFVHVFASAEHPTFVMGKTMPIELGGKLLQLWPIQQERMDWPPLGLSSEEVELATQYYFTLTRIHIEKTWGQRSK